MPGGTTRHNLIVQNIARNLHDPARRRGCRVFAEGVMTQVADDRIYYPDVLVACGAAADIELIIKQPSFVVEVASPSTR